MSHIQYLDELIKEYLLFRGFPGTLKAFDNDLKNDKDKGFRVDKIIEQLMQSIHSHDLNAIRDLWTHLEQKLFSRLEQEFFPAAKKLEYAIYKYYLAQAVAYNKPDKVSEFLSKMTPELQGQNEWKDWFMLPYMKSPEENPLFATYFTKQWQDTLQIALHNFLASVYQVLPLPTLASYQEEALRFRKLEEENESLKQKLAMLAERQHSITSNSNAEDNVKPPVITQLELIDDFYIVGLEATSKEQPAEGQSKGLKTLIRNIGGGLPSSPVMGRKQSGAYGSTEALNIRSGNKQCVSPSNASAGWVKPSIGSDSGGGISKRSSSVEGRSARVRAGRDKSVDALSRRSSGKPTQPGNTFILLSQESFLKHKTTVTQCRFNSSGTLVASSDILGVLNLWCPTPSPRLLTTFQLNSSILCLDWVKRNERYLIVGTESGTILLVDTREHKIIWETGNDSSSLLFNNKVLCVSCSPMESSFICSVVNKSNDGKLLLFDIKTSKMEKEISHGRESTVYVTAVTYNHNGQLLIAGCSDGSVLTIDVRHAECIDSVQCHQTAVHSIQLTPDFNAWYSLGNGDKLYRRSLDYRSNAVAVWEVALKRNENNDSELPWRFVLHHSGSYILVSSGQCSGHIYQISLKGLTLSLELKGHDSPVVACDWTTANQCGSCITASTDGKICVSTILHNAP
ncbi:unnamed protein product [Bemisia tabaci]|uniref:WD repeat-containing protein 91 n=1 Tax=Bemisia tabaci TaxID=7038 RepID=A0A9P0CEM4_BEMTA|nr:unnamed protein product [Bemisia tabaci]